MSAYRATLDQPRSLAEAPRAPWWHLLRRWRPRNLWKRRRWGAWKRAERRFYSSPVLNRDESAWDEMMAIAGVPAGHFEGWESMRNRMQWEESAR